MQRDTLRFFVGAGGYRAPRKIKRNPGRGSQRLHRALGGTRILLAAAPTAPPCFCRWQRSSLSHRGFFPRRTIRRVLRVALAAFSAAPWQGFEKSERGPNNSSLFQPLAAVVVVAVQVLFRTEKEKPVHIVYWFFLVQQSNLNPNHFPLMQLLPLPQK